MDAMPVTPMYTLRLALLLLSLAVLIWLLRGAWLAWRAHQREERELEKVRELGER